MKLVSSEVFRESLKKQYKDQVQSAIFECETDARTTLNLGKLKSKYDQIYKAALSDGLCEQEIDSLIDEVTLENDKFHKNVA